MFNSCFFNFLGYNNMHIFWVIGMKVIFLDIDGVLNSNDFFASNHDLVKQFFKENEYDYNNVNLLVERQMLDIDFTELKMLKDVIIKTDSQVVITSSWKKLKIFPYIVKEFIAFGIPVIGYTIDNGSNRGTGIKKYLMENKVDQYVVLDDDIFPDYDEEIMDRLVKTSFYDNGLEEKHIKKMIKKLN